VISRIADNYEAFKSRSFPEIEFAKEALEESQAFVNKQLEEKLNDFIVILHRSR
jgi:hypothetical protein